MNSQRTAFISNKVNKAFLFPKPKKQNELTPKLVGVANVQGVILELALWDNKAKSGMDFFGGTVKDSKGTKNRLALFSSNKKTPKSPAFFGKFYYDGCFYRILLWEKTSDKCPVYYSGLVNVDSSFKNN